VPFLLRSRNQAQISPICPSALRRACWLDEGKYLLRMIDLRGHVERPLVSCPHDEVDRKRSRMGME